MSWKVLRFASAETEGVMIRADVPHADAAILVALTIEESAIINAIGNCSIFPWQGMFLHFGEVLAQRVLVFPIGGMGNVRAARAAERVIGIWNPALLLLVGIAGGFPASSADMRRGDILVPDQVVGYELAKVSSGGAERRYEVYRPDAELLARARSLRSADWADRIAVPRPGDPGGRIRPLVHVGPVLAGDKVFADALTAADLRRDWPKAIGVEMEGLGVALAAHQNGVGFFMVKAVSDFADSQKDDDWHQYAAAAAACFAVAVMSGSGDLPRSVRQAPGSGQYGHGHVHARTTHVSPQEIVPGIVVGNVSAEASFVGDTEIGTLNIGRRE